jgi:hypothetical protein
MGNGISIDTLLSQLQRPAKTNTNTNTNSYTSLEDRYNSVVQQNQLIESQISNLKIEYSTDNQKINFQLEKIGLLNYINYYLFIIYYVLVAISIFLLIFKSPEISTTYKSLYISLMITAPWVLDIFRQLLFYFGKNILHYLDMSAYTPNNL